MLLHKDKAEFLNNCYKLIEKLGKKEDIVVLGSECKGRVYDDELIYVAISDDKQQGEVERKNTNHSIIFIQNGEVIHFHRDYIFLSEYVNELLEN